jgi:DHA1 family tetracycline resistance protein-like MFS transporter
MILAMGPRRASLAFIFVTATLDMIGMGLVIPSLPHIMQRFLADPADISRTYGYFISLFSCMQFLASPLLGALSDRFGRRPILLNSLFVAGLDYLLMAFAPSLTLLFVGRILSGLTSACFTVAMAYIADISTDESRAKNFGMVGAAFGLGFIVGPALGGLLTRFDPRYPFLLAAGLNLANFLFGLFVLPESWPAERRRRVDFRSLSPLRSIGKIFRLPGVLALAGVHFLFQLASATHPSIWILYTERRFQWTSTEVGLSLALVGVLAALAQGWLTGVLVPKLGEYRAVILGTIGYTVTYALFGFATTSWMLYAILAVSSVFWIANPALQSLLTKRAPPEEQGELQGSLMSLTSLASIINPLVTTRLFAYYTAGAGSFALLGAPYFFAAAVCALSFPLLLGARNAA